MIKICTSVFGLAAVSLCFPLLVARAQNNERNVKLITKETAFGKRHRVFNDDFFFSPDGKRLAYWALTGAPPDPKGPNEKDWVRLIVNGVPSQRYDYTSNESAYAVSQPPGTPIFSPDSKHLAYRALRDAQWMVVRDGKEGPLFKENYEDLYENNGADVIDDIIFSSDSQHLAYRARRNGQWHVFLDGKADKPYDWIADDDLHFSADSKRLAYHARRGKKDILVLHDGKRVMEMPFKPAPLQPKPTVENPTPMDDTKTDQASIVERDGEQGVLWNGREGKFYHEIDHLTTGPNDQHLAYWARSVDRWHIVVDGIEGKGYVDGLRPEPFLMPSERGLGLEGTINRLQPLVFLDAKTVQTVALRSDNEIVGVRIEIVED